MDFDNSNSFINLKNSNYLIDENKDILEFYNQNPNGLITKKQLKQNLKEIISDDELIESIFKNIPFQKVAPIKFIYEGFLKEYSKIFKAEDNKKEEYNEVVYEEEEEEEDEDEDEEEEENFCQKDSNSKTSIVISAHNDQIEIENNNNIKLNLSNEIKNYIKNENDLTENNLILEEKVKKLKIEIKNLKDIEKKKKELEIQFEELVENDKANKKQINDLKNQINN
ncbi:hypothetical protein DICPUDRAFT_85103, partial [Dictyostelium purpureum]